MYDLIKKNRLLYILSLFLIVLYSLMDIGKSILMSEIFDDEQLLESVTKGIGIIFIFLIGYLTIMILQQYLVEKLKNKIRYNVNKNLYDVYLLESPSEFRKNDSSAIINELNNEVSIIIDSYVSSKLNIFFYVVSFIFGTVYIGVMSFEILIFLYICGFSTLIVNQCMSKTFKKNQIKIVESQQNWIKTIKNFCINFRVIKNYCLENRFEEIFDAKNRDLEFKMLRSNGFIKVATSMNSGISQVMFFGTLLFGVILIDQDVLTIGKLIGIVQASNMIISPIVNYANLKNNINASVPILESYREKVQTKNVDNNQILNDSIDSITVSNLNFSYGPKQILENINLTFEKGKKYLIVGESGCGKSTLLEILAKQINCADIMINDENLNQINFKSYINKVSYLTQDSHLLPFTLEENISLGKEKGLEVDLILEQLNLKKLITRKQDVFSEDNPELSGGELQRINLARALFNKKEWLFLDEAFSALDKENSETIEQLILMDEDLSVISISHKLNPKVVKKYDTVIKMENKSITLFTPNEYINKFALAES